MIVVPQGLVDIGSGTQLGIREATSWTSSSPWTPSSTCLVEVDPEVDSRQWLTLLLRKDMEVLRLEQPMQVQLNKGKVVSKEALTPDLLRLPHRRMA